MEERGFKVGDVVELRSGSPDMTVENVEGVDVDCVWFTPSANEDYSDLPDRDSFIAGSLRLVLAVDEGV